ncbi:TPA: DUF2971 domain-containing protein [Providencia alcalifaciens]
MTPLYKYTTANNCKHILKNHSFRWSNISEFNDPFECLFLNSTDLASNARTIAITLSNHSLMLQNDEIKGYIEQNPSHPVIIFISELREKIRSSYIRLINNYTVECYNEIERDIHNFLVSNNKLFMQFNKTANKNLLSDVSKKTFDSSGVLCLSKSKNNILMWSHYSKDHSGVMFELDKDKFHFGCEVSISEVKYQNNVPKCSYDDLLGINRKLFKSQNDSLFNIMISTKSLSWCYEEEVRLLRIISNDQRLYPLPIDAFKAIYLGCKIDHEDKVEIMALAEKNLPNVPIYQTEINKESYTLNYSQINS